MAPVPICTSFLNFILSLGSSPIHIVGFVCCVNRLKTMQKSLQYQKIILFNNRVDHIKKNIENAVHVRHHFFHFIILWRKGSCYYDVSPGFDKFIFIKNTSKTAFHNNPQTHVVDISLFRVLAWHCSLR